MTSAKILLCENDENLGLLLREYLQTKGYEVDWAPDSDEGLNAFRDNGYDLCVLNVTLPPKDGFALMQEIRHFDSRIPIIFLSAKISKDDALTAFRLGADDYITKPFSMEELLLRIEAILRRTNIHKNSEQKYTIGQFTFEAALQHLIFGDQTIRLTTKEASLLLLLAERVDNVLDRNFALKSIWGESNYYNARSMDVYIARLRQKLRSDPNVQILNVHGRGYRLVVAEAEAN